VRFVRKRELFEASTSDSQSRPDPCWSAKRAEKHPQRAALLCPPGQSDGVGATFKDHTGEVGALAYGPGGGVVATSSTDGSVRVWEALTGRQVLILRGRSGPVVDLAFGDGGRRIATASGDGTVRIWDVTPVGGRDWLTIAAHPGGVESVD
jgi:WD40 repeat protein